MHRPDTSVPTFQQGRADNPDASHQGRSAGWHRSGECAFQDVQNGIIKHEAKHNIAPEPVCEKKKSIAEVCEDVQGPCGVVTYTLPDTWRNGKHCSGLGNGAAPCRGSPLHVFNDVHAERLVPTTIYEEPKFVHLQQVARWSLVMCPGEHRELDNGGHYAHLS